MKAKILSVFAAVAIALGVAGTANTAAAANATPVVAAAETNANADNVRGRVRIFIRKGFYHGGYYKPYGYYYIGSYHHCKRLLYKWKVLGSWFAKKRFFNLRCQRYFF